jgi:hypothetical protein
MTDQTKLEVVERLRALTQRRAARRVPALLPVTSVTLAKRCRKCGHFAQSYADCPLAPPYSDGCPHLSGEKKKP